jgi:hypothetical protein
MLVEITDPNGGRSATVDQCDVAATIRPWFPDAPAEVADAVDRLQLAIDRGETRDGWETYLGITVRTAGCYLETTIPPAS